MSAGELRSANPSPGQVEIAAEDEIPETLPAPLNAAEVLEGTLARLPEEPLTLTGTLTVRRQRGLVLHEVPFSIDLAWGASPPRATYRMQDGFGRAQESLTITRRPDGASELMWRDAAGTISTNPPALTDAVQGTDITWMDLSLAFLWWPDAQLDGEQRFRGSLCDIVRVAPPIPIVGCSSMKLWVDRRLRFLRQVEQLDETGKSVRKMWVSSVGRTGDRWMIRNMEVERPGSGQRTKLHVENLDTP